MANRSGTIGSPPSRGRPRSARREVGFTLIEVVVAFVLLSVVLVTVFEIFAKGMARAGELDDYSQALVIAQAKLAAAGVEEKLAEGATAGDSEDGRYHWSLTVARSPESGDPNRPIQGGYSLFQVEAHVAWAGSAGTQRSITLPTLLLAQSK